MNDVVVGAWRNGLDERTALDIAEIEKRYAQGFRQLPYESTVMEMVLILDACDDAIADMMDFECEESCSCAEKKPKKK